MSRNNYLVNLTKHVMRQLGQNDDNIANSVEEYDSRIVYTYDGDTFIIRLWNITPCGILDYSVFKEIKEKHCAEYIYNDIFVFSK